jgi:hypothetical protein
MEIKTSEPEVLNTDETYEIKKVSNKDRDALMEIITDIKENEKKVIKRK